MNVVTPIVKQHNNNMYQYISILVPVLQADIILVSQKLIRAQLTINLLMQVFSNQYFEVEIDKHVCMLVYIMKGSVYVDTKFTPIDYALGCHGLQTFILLSALHNVQHTTFPF